MIVNHHYIKRIQMKKSLLFAIVTAFVASHFSFLQAQDNISDSIDVLHYDLRLDIGNRSFKRMEGSASVTMRLLRQVDSIALELCPADVDSVWVDGVAVPFDFVEQQRLLRVANSAAQGDTLTMTVFYRKGQHIMQQGWGGFYFDNNIYYNLGIAIYEYPHNVGKAWFPCRDNFYDKATYHFEITAKPEWKAICTGLLDTVVNHSDGSSTWCWTLDRQTPTYLVGVAVAPFHVIERQYVSEDGTYPAILGFLAHDSANVWKAYENMSKVIPMYERCFGPYRWDRVGYVSTPKGSMEHVGNVAFTTECMASSQVSCLATMSHEFAHSWFGNLVTCASSADMWINEGGASFCEEVAVQAIFAETNPNRYRTYANDNLRDVLLQTHIRDNGFKPLYGQTSNYTYGSTVYNKGATVWHSLRGYVGDSLFYAAMRKLFDRCAFQNIDSWQLRDSLSLYTGMDLTDFFSFHVFRPGFVDYVIDSMRCSQESTAVYLRQKLYGTDTFANGNRVWVTFFADDLSEARRLAVFDGETTKAVFQLPFVPAFAVVDYDEALSKASIGERLNVNQTGLSNLHNALFRTEVAEVDPSSKSRLYIAHHWSSPDPDPNPHIVKMADHYWTVDGILTEGTKMNGQFRFSATGSDNTLDNDLLGSGYDMSMLRLMYRRGAGDRWRPVSELHSGSTQGYFTDTLLKLGEYTLAYIDEDYVGISQPSEFTAKNVTVYPNPTTGKLTISTGRAGEQLVVEIYDTTGRRQCSPFRTNSGDSFVAPVRAGAYVFVVRRVQGSESVSLNVQVR